MAKPRDIKRKRGGQTKAAADKRSERLVTNWTPAEYAQLRKCAEMLEVGLNEFVRAETLRGVRRLQRSEPGRIKP